MATTGNTSSVSTSSTSTGTATARGGVQGSTSMAPKAQSTAPGLFPPTLGDMANNPNAQQQQSLQQRLFGLVNEANTNLTHVPTGGLVAPGQSFTFQHARYAISGSQLGQLLAQPNDAAARANLVSSMLNHPGLAPIYRPDFVGMSLAGSSPSAGSGATGIPGVGSSATAGQGVPGQVLPYPLPLATANFVPQLPTYTSVIAQRLPKTGGFANPSLGGLSTLYPPATAFSPGVGWPAVLAQGQLNMAAQAAANTVDSDSKQASAGQKRASKRSASAGSEEDVGRKKRKKRDPTLPTPARFAWNFFFRDQYTKIRNSEPSEHSNVQKAFTDIGFDLGKKWKSLTKEEKAPYLKLAAQDKERYEREMQARFGSNAAAVAAAAASSAGASTSEESSEDEAEDEKVCLVVHEVEVEDQRPEEEKKSDPTEGELVADVLVVDDDEVFLKIIRHKLVVGQKNPLRVMTVTSASDAKRMLVDEHKKFGTVLLDKDLGEGKEDGISSLAVIREAGYQGVIVGVTGSTDDKTKSQFAESGADNTFIKGTSNFYDDLLALVKVHSKNAQQMEREESQVSGTEPSKA